MRERYKQCIFASDNRRTVGWILVKHAKGGKDLKLMGLKGTWKTISIGTKTIDKKELRLMQAQTNDTRKASDIFKKDRKVK